jgi:demethylsterigmatocystin 6-O-methyltransferase
MKPLQVAIAKIGVDLHIFETLKDSENALTLSQLADESGASLGLLGRNIFTKRFLVLILSVERILRTQAAFGMIKETGRNEFTANRFTRLLADPNASGAITQV